MAILSLSVTLFDSQKKNPVIMSGLILVWRFPIKMSFETAHSASSSTDVDALKFLLVQYGDTFHDGQIQQGSSECLMLPLKVINKGSVPYRGSDDNNYTVVSSWNIISIYVSKINCPRCIWTDISLIWVHYCVVYYTYLYIYHAGVDNARKATKIKKVLLLM